jgi:protein SCO1/2
MRASNLLNSVLILILALTGISCKTRKNFEVKGIIQEVFPKRKQVRIQHEEIPHYMPSMTMTFDVKNDQDLAGLQPGDSVSFHMIVTEKEGWIEQIRKTGAVTPIVTSAPDNFRAVREVEPLKEGDMMPDYHFTNELGQAMTLSDYKGQALALTFIFTRCPFPNFCPRMSDNFGEAQKRLKTMSNPAPNWHLLSISFDPEFDKPPVLKAYSLRFGADPKRWNFATGALIDVTAITEQFGLMFWKPTPEQPGSISHNLRTVVINASGRIQKVFTENGWKVDDLVAEIVKAAGAKQ